MLRCVVLRGEGVTTKTRCSAADRKSEHTDKFCRLMARQTVTVGSDRACSVPQPRRRQEGEEEEEIEQVGEVEEEEGREGGRCHLKFPQSDAQT